MDDLISRQATVKAIEQHKTAALEGHIWDERIEHGYAAAHRHLVDIIEQLPSVQPERKTGRWIPDNTDYYRTKFICSACGESEEVPTMGFGYAPMWGYCPNCGADMRGEQE